MKAQLVKENIKFERGKDPKRAMGIGIQPISWDETVEAYENSDIQRLINPEDRWGDPELDSFFEPEDYDEDTESFTKFSINCVIDHPMSGYNGTYNSADVSLDGEKLPDGKIHVTGIKEMDVGKIRKGEDGDYDGERYGGKISKPQKVDWLVDNMEDLFDGLEEIPQ